MRYKKLLFDVDDTLLDFSLGEEHALQILFEDLGITNYDEAASRYIAINKVMWSAAEKGDLTIEDIITKRFDELLVDYNIEADGVDLDNRFRNHLADKDFSFDGVYDMLARLEPNHTLAIVTNGVSDMQEKRLKKSQIYDFFSHHFVSDVIAVQKPDERFFAAVEAGIPQFVKEEALIIGDSLTSDMEGGYRAGIDTCWYNRKNKALPTQPITYIITHYDELEALLQWQNPVRIRLDHDDLAQSLYFVGNATPELPVSDNYAHVVAALKEQGFIATTLPQADHIFDLNKQINYAL